MIKVAVLFAVLLTVMTQFSCKKGKIDDGVPTILKGHVSDSIRGTSIGGYKIVLIKEVGLSCADWECLPNFEEVATAYTNDSGDYSISFDYKLQPGQGYYYKEVLRFPILP